jgi:glucose-1-phosphate cytidylyltransferase
MATYGDGVSDVDVKKLLAFHKAHGKLATVTTVRPISRFGVLKLDSAGLVSGFDEKPQLDGWINVGFFVFERAVFDYLSSDPNCVLEQEPLQHLARDGQLVAYRHDGFFYAMDTYRELKLLNTLWDSGEAPWKVWR